ncbi:hypothetical protein JHK87_051640 [Glycine soja]|nr:hypothetical protein JHK87_051640 [Glycine soja]
MMHSLSFSIFPSTTWGIPSLKAIMVSTLGSLRMYRMECVKINTLWSGEIDCDGFEAKLLCHKDKPAIVNVNIGTTVKGAMDDLDLVIKKLEEAGFSRDRFYIHCDGALFGLMLSFVKREILIENNSNFGIFHKGCKCYIHFGNMAFSASMARGGILPSQTFPRSLWN